MDITLDRYPEEHGGKTIYVDGVLYGFIHMKGHGGQGNSYYFTQAGGYVIYDGETDYGKPREVVVEGDKIARHRAAAGETVLPVAQRLLSTARSLVERGLLKSFDQYRAEQALNDRARQEIHERIEREEEQLFRAKAQQAISVYYPGQNRDELVDSVVGLMRWAQSQ